MDLLCCCNGTAVAALVEGKIECGRFGSIDTVRPRIGLDRTAAAVEEEEAKAAGVEVIVSG